MTAKSAKAGGRRKAGKAVEGEAQQAKAHPPPPPPPPSREEEKSQMAKALGHPTRLQILTVAHQRAIRPSEFAKSHGKKTSTVCHHFEKLVEYGAIKLVRQEKVGG